MASSSPSDATAATAIIGGSGLYALDPSVDAPCERVPTPYAAEPVGVYRETVDGRPLWFLPRHGKSHAIPPHRINYRANLWALRELGVRRIYAVNAVGGITASMDAGRLVVPDQLIDYTWGREPSYFDGSEVVEGGSLHKHIDFTHPYDPGLRDRLIASCRALGHTVATGGVYACTQGPRLETAAEVRRLRSDGCDIVGMTGMPEAALARELDIAYACLALVVNRAAGTTEKLITLEQIQGVLDTGISEIRAILRHVLSPSAGG